jgi:hypothetical protein
VRAPRIARDVLANMNALQLARAIWEPRFVAAVDVPRSCRSNRIMKTFAKQPLIRKTLIASSVAALALVASQAAEAKGCIKGAIVGGVAGHYAGHHGMLGAAAGCLYGRHRARQQDLQQERDPQRQQQGQANGRGGI